MVFSTPIFLFGFLPLILLFYYASPNRAKNIVLLIGSLIFYSWGEVFYVMIMVVSIISNHAFGILISKNKNSLIFHQDLGRILLGLSVAINMMLLCTFKYANFIVDNINISFEWMNLDPIKIAPIHLPLGISFFTFQAISYLVDVYRKETPAQKNIFNLALYISSFPQLIAGPIVRYHYVAAQIIGRVHSMALMSSGIQRFVYGMAKKMLIANPLGEVADNIFHLSGNELSTPLAWVGVTFYSLQIYFDFSGYSDMAIGLGRMFGFRFRENFNYPYISKSLREFWRRWHISLSTWFRDYLYIPLGGNRVSSIRLYLNLFVVFVLCGLWHGASWNFVIWGLIHGVFLMFERSGLSTFMVRLWSPIRHIYTLLIVLVAWVFFRAETLPFALRYLKVMFGIGKPFHSIYSLEYFITYETILALIFGVLFSLPVYIFFAQALNKYAESDMAKQLICYYCPKFIIVSTLMMLSVLKISSSTYNPFIYFRF